VVDSRFDDKEWAAPKVDVCVDTPKWLPLATDKLASPILVAPIRETASTLAASEKKSTLVLEIF
jgi:hypothetical protein